jgi:hypothetical protein
MRDCAFLRRVPAREWTTITGMVSVPKMRRSRTDDHFYQFLIVLPDTDPLVWRRIQVPATYSFWDLHVAIQDSMGWLDYHLHEFQVVTEAGRLKRIGIPDDEMPDERPCVAGWRVPISRYLSGASGPVRYLYDFGDGWRHALEFEGYVPGNAERGPQCVSGAGRCPPEDVGGTHGYREFLRTIRDRRHPERADMLRWAGGEFDPHQFDCHAVRFDDPRERWQKAFRQR